MAMYQMVRRFNKQGDWEDSGETLSEEELMEVVNLFMRHMTPHGTTYVKGTPSLIGCFPDSSEIIEISWREIVNANTEVDTKNTPTEEAKNVEPEFKKARAVRFSDLNEDKK